MNLLKNLTTTSIAGVLLFSLSCDDRLPSESTATVETGSLELSYVFVHGSTSNPTIVGRYYLILIQILPRRLLLLLQDCWMPKEMV